MHLRTRLLLVLFFFNDTATTEIYTLSLHDALPIYRYSWSASHPDAGPATLGAKLRPMPCVRSFAPSVARSEEHTSELQSPDHLVCRLLLEKKKQNFGRHDASPVSRSAWAHRRHPRH